MRNLAHYTLAWVTVAMLASSVWAAPPERPTFNHNGDPRPNILPNWMFIYPVPYRATHNRPTDFTGRIARVISPTSQEAMTWSENKALGYYDGHHQPPLKKGFFFPKPWEVLNIGPRKNTNAPEQPQIMETRPEDIFPAPAVPTVPNP